jgi:hypothetical protein
VTVLCKTWNATDFFEALSKKLGTPASRFKNQQTNVTSIPGANSTYKFRVELTIEVSPIENGNSTTEVRDSIDSLAKSDAVLGDGEYKFEGLTTLAPTTGAPTSPPQNGTTQSPTSAASTTMPAFTAAIAVLFTILRQ